MIRVALNKIGFEKNELGVGGVSRTTRSYNNSYPDGLLGPNNIPMWVYPNKLKMKHLKTSKAGSAWWRTQLEFPRCCRLKLLLLRVEEIQSKAFSQP